jgi:hypothetical protein
MPLERKDNLELLVSVRFLEADEVRAGRLQQPVNVEHVHPGLRLLQRHALRNQRRAQQIGKTNASRAGAIVDRRGVCRRN